MCYCFDTFTPFQVWRIDHASIFTSIPRDAEGTSFRNGLNERVRLLASLSLPYSLQDDDGGGTLNIRELLGAIRDKKTGQAIVKACSKLKPLLDEDIW